MLGRLPPRKLLSSIAAALSLSACTTSEGATSAGDAGATDDAAPPITFGGARPVDVRVPAAYDPAKPAPLLLMLHGYGSAGRFNEIYIRMPTLADAKGFFYVSPDGTVDSKDKHFWNATDACCNFDGADVDDVGYLMSLVKDLRAAYSIDPKRIFVMGHSNGGYMTNRLACDHAETFAAAVSFAGGNWNDPSRCKPTEPIGYLQIHGTKDGSVPFAAAPGPGQSPYPGAAGVVALWAQWNGCDPTSAETGATLRVNADATAPDTKVARHDRCRANGAAELWPVDGAPHTFTFSADALEAVWQFLDAHAKP